MTNAERVRLCAALDRIHFLDGYDGSRMHREAAGLLRETLRWVRGETSTTQPVRQGERP